MRPRGARAFGSDIPGFTPRRQLNRHCDLEEAMESPLPVLHLLSEEKVHSPSWEILPPQNRTRLDSWKTAGSQFLCAESMAVELWGSLTSDRRGRGAAHRALPLPPKQTRSASCAPASVSPHPPAASRVRQFGTHLCASAGWARRPGLPALLRAPEGACAVAVSEPKVLVL